MTMQDMVKSFANVGSIPISPVIVMKTEEKVVLIANRVR